jgi:hypothetical protein
MAPKDLIIVRAGNGSLHPCWLDRNNSARTWDLLVCPHEELASKPSPNAGVLVSSVIDAPAKYIALKTLLGSWHDWRNYRYVVLADDDLFASQQTWSRFFERVAQIGAKLAQPALAESSHFSHSVTVRNTEFVARRVSFVEAMTPCFRVDVLDELRSTFDLSASGEGWGLDFLWSKMLGYTDVLVIDETPVLHTRPLRSHGNPELHNRLNGEMATIMRDHQVPFLLKTFAGILPNGEEIAEGDAAFLYRLFRGYERVFAQDPKRFDEMIRLQLMPAPGR